MITLYCFGPRAGLPDGSPFVMKAMLLLKLAGLEFIADRTGFRSAPKGKLPYINDGGTIVADSTFIRFHIEKTRGVDFDSHLSSEQKAIAWSVEKMCEDHLLWIVARIFWLDDANFQRGPAQMFGFVPAPMRPLVRLLVRRKVRQTLHAQGMGRHDDAQLIELGERDVEALATLIGDKPYLFGDTPCAADASVFAFVSMLLCPSYESPLRDFAVSRTNLIAYRDRIMQAYFPSAHE